MSSDNPVAHLNFATLSHDWDDERVAGFVNNLALVNAAATRSKGYVWRFSDETDDGGPNDPKAVFGDNPRNAMTLSVWDSAEALDDFVNRTIHGKFLARRGEWFEPAKGPAYVIWPVAAGHRPTLAEGKAMLDRLGAEGPSDAAYDFKYARQKRSDTEAA